MINNSIEKREESKTIILRDKTSTIFGEGVLPFVKQFQKIMTGGNIAIIYKDQKIADIMAKSLDAALYNVKFFQSNKPIRFPTFIKGIIAIGDEKELTIAKRLSKDSLYFYYCIKPNLGMFSCTTLTNNEKYKFAEFIYFDTSIINVRDTNIAFILYQSLFSVLTECIEFSYYESMFPFQNKGIIGIIDSIKKLLIDGIDEDNFLRESIRLMKVAVESLALSGQYEFVSCSAKLKFNLSNERVFLCDYFINILMLYFTKWDFFDMLIPAKELIMGINSIRPNWRGMAQNQLLSDTKLQTIAKKVSCLVELPNIDICETIRILQKVITKDNPLLAEINNRGILEGLINGRFERH
ncbi:MAG: hypothetical protein WCR54_04660 [Clostridia bacterium]